jgi:hypothetical protein
MAVPQLPDAEQICIAPASAHCADPGSQTPVQDPATQAWFTHAAKTVQTPQMPGP